MKNKSAARPAYSQTEKLAPSYNNRKLPKIEFNFKILLDKTNIIYSKKYGHRVNCKYYYHCNGEPVHGLTKAGADALSPSPS